MNFEYAFAKLEEIVNRLEGGEESLESLVKLYGEGLKLVDICKKKLCDAKELINGECEELK